LLSTFEILPRVERTVSRAPRPIPEIAAHDKARHFRRRELEGQADQAYRLFDTQTTGKGVFVF